MRTLSHHNTAKEAEDIGCILEERGIATCVSGKYEEWAGGPISGPAGAALCVILDKQYDDAVQVLSNPDHEVKVKLSPHEITSIKSSMKEPNIVRSMLPVLVKLLIFAGLFALIVKLLITYYDAT